jgi:hypothetical protein
MCLYTRPTFKWHFVPRLPNGSPEIPKVETPTTLGPHNFVCKPPIEMRSEAKLYTCWELSNGILHATYTQGNRVDSQLLVVGSQTTNLTPDPSFGHILCFRCLNGSCKPISDIYVPRAFQWYKVILNPLSFGPCNHPLKIRKSIGTPTPKVETPLRVWRFIPSHSLPLLGAYGVIPGLPSWLATLQALALVVSPRLGLWQLRLNYI